ncbi:MAG TPA: ATP-dependent zinc metalloprotease FtsH [Acidobacteriota bacterium]|nr:ATP-dependent zinc metalloprotease FtsH [Acidobacteriota bacterium]
MRRQRGERPTEWLLARASGDEKASGKKKRFSRSDGGGKGGLGQGMQSWSLMWRVLFIALLIWLLLQIPWGGQEGREISYSQFRRFVEQGRVAEITVQGEQVSGRLKTVWGDRSGAQDSTGGEGDGGSDASVSGRGAQFVTYLPTFGDDGLFEELRSQGVEIKTRPSGEGENLWMLVFTLLPFIFLIALAIFFMRRMQNQGQGIFNIGRSRAKSYDRSGKRTSFDEVAGCEGAKRELQELIAFLKDPQRFRKLGGKPPTGVLLVGPPGTGKTLLARATAGEAEVPFYSLTGSDFMEMFVGVGASRVRDLFEQARKNAPCIVFIDELDSIGRRRGAGLGGGHDEREQTLNQLLSEMDGFESHHGVIVLAATNRPDILDRALLRPGRFDRHITVDMPTAKARQAILRVHTRNTPLADDVDIEELARATPGFSGADLENLVNEAALLAGREEKKSVDRDAFEQARDKVLMGLRREGLTLSEKDRKILAYHEAGHAVVAARLPNADPVHKVTIIPRGRAMGVTQQLPTEDKYLYDKEYLLDRLAVVLGGRASERLIFETSTSGAADDLKQAAQMARKMVIEWGMSEKVGQLAWGGEHDEVFLGQELTQRRHYSESTADEIDVEIKLIVDSAFQRATETLKENREGLDRLAARLLEKEEVDGKQVLELLSENGSEPPQPEQAGDGEEEE